MEMEMWNVSIYVYDVYRAFERQRMFSIPIFDVLTADTIFNYTMF